MRTILALLMSVLFVSGCGINYEKALYRETTENTLRPALDEYRDWVTGATSRPALGPAAIEARTKSLDVYDQLLAEDRAADEQK